MIFIMVCMHLAMCILVNLFSLLYATVNIALVSKYISYHSESLFRLVASFRLHLA